MRLFVSGPRIAGLRFGAILRRRDASALWPWAIWQFPIALALGIGSVLAVLFVADYVSYLPR